MHRGAERPTFLHWSNASAIIPWKNVMEPLHLFGFPDTFLQERTQVIQILEMVVFRAAGALY
jgi:hypothetical protein